MLLPGGDAAPFDTLRGFDDAKGKLEHELPCEARDIAECLAGFAHPIERVGFEAGTMSQHLFFGLTAEGFDVVRMEARQVNVVPHLVDTLVYSSVRN
jgi:transposase